MKNKKLKIRGEKKVKGVTYITLAQVVDDYVSGRSSETVDADSKIEENKVSNVNTFNAENYLK